MSFIEANPSDVIRKQTRLVNKILSKAACGVILFKLSEKEIVFSNQEALSLCSAKEESDLKILADSFLSSHEETKDFIPLSINNKRVLAACNRYRFDDEDYIQITILPENDSASASNQNRNMVLDLQNKLEKSERILSAVGKDYLSLFYCDAEQDTLSTFVGDLENCTTYAEYISNFIQKYCADEKQEEIIGKLSKTSVLTALNYGSSYEVPVKTMHENGVIDYLKFRYFPIENSTDFLFGILNVSDSVKKEIKNQEKLEAALQAATSASNAKTVFLSNMSHDIRTPLNAIIGFTELCGKAIDDREKSQDYLRKIASSSNHLLNLINDILDMSRIESGKMHISDEKANINVIIDELYDMIKSNANDRKIHLNVEKANIEHANIYCDSLRLKQLLINLLSNAVKFTPEGGSVTFSIREKEFSIPGSANYIFSVQDTGIGMSEDFLEKLFVPFERERTSTISGIQGTGLGMSICKSICDMMGGTIHVDSELGVGTTFTVNLGFLVQDEAENETPIIQTSDSLQDVRILLVEDNELNLEIATELLSAKGAVIDICRNGLEAVHKFEEKGPSFDCILMDVQMPVMDGYTATQKIREIENGSSRIPIIAMTANAFAEDKKNAIAAGMDAHIAKPINLDIVSKTIRGLLN